MKVKKIMLITFVLLAILAIGTVSASDDADFNEALTTDNVDEVSLDASADDELIFESGGDELAAISQDDVISDVSDEIVASSDSDVISNWTTGNSTVVISNVTNSSFAGNTSDVDFGDEYELINLIEDNNAHDTLVLDKDYIFTGPIHDDSSIGISIYKPMTIDGQGHTIDANNYCTIFAIDSQNIVLVNINFRNGHVSDDYSGGVLGGGNSNLAIVNCSFENNMATDTPNAGAIAMMGDNITISNSLFVNNSGYGMGGAITIRGNDITISDCVFRNNCVNSEDESETRGGAIYIDGENGNILNCVFNNNSADLGSDIYIEGISETFMIDDCISDAGESSIYFDDGSGDNHVDIIIFIDEEENFPLTGEDVDDGFVAISIPSDMEAYVLINSSENVFFNMSFYFFNPNKIGPEDDREDYTRYVVSPQDVIFFEGLSDEDEIEIGIYDYGDNKLESKTYRVFFEGDTIRFEGVGGEDDDEDEWTGPSIIVDTQKNYSIPDDSDYEFITVYAQNGEEYHVVIFSSSKMFFDKNLTDFENKFPVENDPELEGYYKYIITPRDVDFFNGIDELDRICIGVYKIEDDYRWIDAGPEYYKVFFNGNSSFSLLNVIDIRMFYGNFTSGETAEGMVSFTTEKFISIGIPESADVNEMNITVDYGSETRTYSLADFNIEESDPEDEEFEGTYYYMNLTDDIKELIRQNENKTIIFNFTYDFKGRTISASFKRVLMGEIFYQIVSISDLYNLFDFKIADDVLVNSTDEAVRVFCFDDNWHVAHNDWGGGYFKVYVDNTMIKSYELHEDLVNRAVTGYISLSLEDLGISEGGVYNIRITHLPNPGIDIYEDEVTGELITRPSYIWVGETELMNKNITADFGYTEVNSTIEISDIEFDYGETGSAEVTLGGASNITANVEGYDGANVTFNNGILTVSGLNAGNYTLIITTVPDEGYAAVSKSVNIKVNKITSSLTVTVSNITFGDVAVVNIGMDEMINGVIVLSIANRNYTVNVVNGKAGLNVTGLNVGTYEVTAVFAGNDNYESVTETTTVSVVPAVSDLVVSVADISVGDVAVVIVEMDEAIIGEITISIDGRNYAVNVVNGKGDLNVTGLNPGTYQVIAVFAGNDNFNSVINTTSFSVSKLEPTIEINSGEAIEGSDLEVTVNMNDDATGIVVVNGESVGLVGGQAQTVIKNLTAGNLTIVVTYNGDEKYLSASSSINVTVIPKQNPDLTVSVANINVGEVAVVNIEINAGATGKVIVDGNEVEITNGKATFNITGLAAGNHTITVVYPGDKYFNPGEVTTAITVEEIFVPVDSPLTVTVSNITFGDVAVVYVEMDEMINDVIVLSIANVNYTVNVVNGKGDLNVTGLNPGTYQVIAVFAGNDNFNPVINTTSFIVSKQDSDLVVSVANIREEDIETINVTVGPVGVTGIVLVDIYGTRYYANLSADGSAVVVVPGLKEGNYTAVVTYMGDSNYNNATASVDFKVSGPIVINVDRTGNSTEITVVVPGNETGGTVTIYIDGVWVNTTDVVNGSGTVDLGDLAPGEHNVTVDYVDENGVESVVTTITVPKWDATVVPSVVNIREGDVAVVIVEMNEAITGEITISIDGRNYAVNVVNGKAGLNVTGLNAGTYQVTVVFAGNDYFNPVINTTSFSVSKLEPTIEINSGEAIEGSDLEVTVNMNDDATGIVVVNGESVGLVGGQAQTVIKNLTAGNLTIVVTYYGDEKYLSASSSINVTVIPKQNPDLTVSVEDINVGETAVVNIELNPGATGKVIVDGNEVEITNGKATFNITGLAAGNHTITVVYPGDKYFNADEVTTAITVEEIFVPVDSPLTVTVSNITFGDVAVVIVEMDEMINDVIVLSIANVNYTVNVVNGKGDLNVTGLNPGTYQVIAVFAGNDNFNSVINTTSFIVSKLEPTIEINSGEAIEGSDLEVTVNMNDDATGIVVVNGESVGLVGGQAQTVIKNLTAGNLTIVVTYYGDEKYLSASSSINVTVIPKQNPELKVSAENIAFGETAVVNIEIDANVTGKVTISGNDVIISNGKGTYNISGLSAGNHTVTVVFAGDKYFNADEKTVMITVNEVIPEIIPVDPQLTIAPIADAVEGSDVTLVVSANDTFTGTVKVFVGENEVAIINMVDGKGSAAIAADKLTVGANTVKVTSEASEHFLAGEDTKTFTVTLSKTVTKDTFNKYFDANGVYIADLDEIVFSGEFTGIPKITISKAVSITGQDAVFADTVFNINADNVVISYLTINTDLTDYAVTLSGASQVSLINNNLNAINGILISDCANFTIDSNNIISTAGENINGIYINGTGSGVVRNNNLDLKSTKTAYAINTNPTGPLRVSYINNTIVAESYFAVGIYDDAELIKDNDILLKGNYAIGIAVLSEATVEGNGITLTTTNTGDVDDIDEPLGVETTGIKVNNDATITNNNVDSTGKSMSVVGGSSTISDNTLNGQVSIASNDNTIINNVITTTEDSAIDASSATGNTITSNEAYSSQGNGDDAIKAGEGNTVEGNFEKFDPALTISIADITEGADAVIVITTNNSFTGPVSVQIIGHSNITVDVTNGTGSLPVSGLGVGTYDAVATFKTTDIFTESIKNTTFTVKAKVATAVSAAAVTTTYATSKNIVVTLKDANGNPLAGKDVTITLNGASKTIKTDSKGQVSYAIGTKLAPNKYDATVKFAGDNTYVASTGSVKVTVNKAKAKMTAKKQTFKAKKKTKKYSIVLKTDKNKALKKVKVTIKVKGKTYTAKTNSKGKATFNLKKLTKKGKHTATVKFKGNKYYNAVTKKVKITVKK